MFGRGGLDSGFRWNDGDGTIPTATGEFYIDMQDVQDWRLG